MYLYRTGNHARKILRSTDVTVVRCWLCWWLAYRTYINLCDHSRESAVSSRAPPISIPYSSENRFWTRRETLLFVAAVFETVQDFFELLLLSFRYFLSCGFLSGLSTGPNVASADHQSTCWEIDGGVLTCGLCCPICVAHIIEKYDWKWWMLMGQSKERKHM